MKLRKILVALLALVVAFSASAFSANAYTDVAEDAYYADAADWAVEKGIIGEVEAGRFAPELVVNRAEAVAFLWRMAGEPEPTQAESFNDVEADPDNGWYLPAVRWAAENGVTNGTGNGLFSPTEPCSRGMILTMLYRMEGNPWDEVAAAELPEEGDSWTLTDMGTAMIQFFITTFRSENGFTDIPEDAYYELPIFWAVTGGIMDMNHYDSENLEARPTAPCPRGEMAYFLYRASGEAPVPAAPGAVETGTIPETELLSRNGVTVTAAGIRADGSDAVLDLIVKNGSDKALRVDSEALSVNTFMTYGQACIPTESEEGWLFYGDAVVQPGETANCELRLNSLDEKNIDAVRELELRLSLVEVEWNEEDEYYNWVDEFAVGETVSIRTSLYDASVSYDMEGTTLLDENGLKVLLLGAENDESWGPSIKLYICNSSDEDLLIDVGDMKLDGESYECLFSADIPAGKRSVEEVTAFSMDEVPTAGEVELTFRILDPETWEPTQVLDPVTVTIPA